MLCRVVQADLVVNKAMKKADNSPVTVADFGSQALVCRRLKAAFPGDEIVAEENASVLRSQSAMLETVCSYVRSLGYEANAPMVCDWIDSGNGRVGDRYWTLDPIDGTKGFLRNEQYAVALALVEKGDVKVAVLACPALQVNMEQTNGESGVLFVAVRGEGTEVMPLGKEKGHLAHVAGSDAVASWCFVESVEASHSNHDLQKAIAQTVGIHRPSLRMDSQAKYGCVARGDAVLYLRLPSPKQPDYREKIWDHAAGSLVVEESGGSVTDMHGRPLDFKTGALMEKNQGVVVSNRTIHEQVLETLKQTRLEI
jgi:3'(2'), 5'-bisphosphate nucleotidase